MIERLAPSTPLTPRAVRVVALIEAGWTYREIAEMERTTEAGIRALVRRVASRIPGSLESRAKLIVWWRGATIAVLSGTLDLPTSPTTRAARYAHQPPK
jgi:DNA-binding NarL/FixJ family response regulator